MSGLLDAIAGVPNASEPLAGLTTGGQPAPPHVKALAGAGCQLILDCRDPMEPRPVREPEDIEAAGMEYVCVPMGHGRGADETLTQIRDVLRANADRKVFFHCASGNRVGAALIPYLILDRQIGEEEAVNAALRTGLRSAELMEWALEYVRQRR